MTTMTTLDEIRDSLEGAVPSVVATCSADGTPNVCYLSQIEYVDETHVALTFQFFNKTRHNILANPLAVAAAIDPISGAGHRLWLRYLRTETHGPVFERMKAKLASIASITGASAIFRLRGSDIYRVERIEAFGGSTLEKPARRNRLSSLRACSDMLAASRDLGGLLDALLLGLSQHFAIEHAMVLALDARGERFYTLASRGYDASGVGSEIPLGAGTVGIAAARRTPIRLAHAAAEYAYVRALREQAMQDPVLSERLEHAIAFPGLRAPHSQLSVPIESGERVLGVLHVESAEDRRFTYEDEDALVTLARQFGLALQALDTADDGEPASANTAAITRGEPLLVVRHFASNDSVFLGDDYLIKGVAGAILWKLLRAFVEDKRDQFSNRELRADRTLGLPDFSDNLEARIFLLQRRLRERDAGIALEKTGRGKFRLRVARTLSLTAG
jgi:adenylate cyclase